MNKYNPLVSVHMTTYNSSLFIEETLLSVLEQDYDNFEIVISDDCSTDNTATILLEYKEKFPGKIKVNLNQTNQGVTRNSNNALRLCSGKYIAFLGGDDLFLPGKISTQVNFMEADEACVISYHNVDVFLSENNKTIGYYNSFVGNKAYQGDKRILLRKGCFCSSCSIMIRRANIPTYGYNEKYLVASDYVLFIESLMLGGEIKYIPGVYSRYRRHKHNITSSGSPLYKQTLRDTLSFLNDIVIDYPDLSKYALEGIGVALRAMRLLGNNSYGQILWVSFKLSPSGKSLIGLFIYLLTLGNCKV